jgi:hypothetical protein
MLNEVWAKIGLRGEMIKVRGRTDACHSRQTGIKVSLPENQKVMATSLNGVIVYRSRAGATQQYAMWIKEELRIPMIDPERLDDRILSICDFVVIGTPVYTGEMLVRDWLWSNHHRLSKMRLFLFVVCAHFSDSEKRRMMIDDNIPPDIVRCCELHFLPGRPAEPEATVPIQAAYTIPLL